MLFREPETETMPAAKPRRRFDDAFKRDAIRNLIESGKSTSAFALALGVDRTILHKWKKSFGDEFTRPAAPLNGDTVNLPEFLMLKSEVKSLKDTLFHLRNAVRKTLAAKYLHD
jgi:transposase-like protein